MSEPSSRADGLFLLLAVFVAAVCGLVYQLIAGALSSYLLGDSVTQFSLVIGLFLTAMGIGSYLSRFVRRDLIAWFIGIEIGVGALGGALALLGFLAFAFTRAYLPVLLGMGLAIGTLVGMEIPLVIRILRERQALRLTLANVLSVDYVGALAASLAFPFLLLPHLGLVRAGMAAGLLNVLVGLMLVGKFGHAVPRGKRGLVAAGLGIALLLAAGVGTAQRLTTFVEDNIYRDRIILAQDTSYQRMVITRWKDDIRLYLNGHLQFSSVDEHRYHEALVHPAMCLADRRRHVLILGGGDGLAARQLLKYPEVERIDLVDLDPAVTSLFHDHSLLARLNEGALADPRVTIHNNDAMRFLEETDQLYDVILMDLPDPSEPVLGKLYSKAFYELAGRRLAAGGAMAAQSTSPFRAREAFWCIATTAEAARWGSPESPQRFHVAPYHTVVPTFGTWGFTLASTKPIEPADLRVTVPTKYLTSELLPTLFVFPPDMARVPTPVSRLNHPVVVDLYRRGYSQYLE